MDEREFVIILSDIHIGTTAPTVWYRKEVHEKYLTDIFNNIIDCANKIQEVILLGDIFEFWSYPPNELPPTLDDIIDANPNILGSKGKLRQALSALKGRIVYICGEHDINITEEDLNKIKSFDGYTIKYNYGTYIPSYDTGILFTHGHEFTLLNAPYFRSKLAPLPIGYFVTRAIAYKVQSILSKTAGLTIANLEEDGAFDLTEFLSKIPNFLKSYENGPDFVSKFIDAIAYSTSMPKDLRIQVDENTTVSLNEVKEIYKNLLDDFHDFLKKLGLSDQTILLKALSAEFKRSYLPWYVNKDVLGKSINIVVMGHTHSPIITFSNDMIDYVNTGYMCPSIPDLREKPITYGIYSRSKRLVSLMKVADNTPNSIQPYSNQIELNSINNFEYLKNVMTNNDSKDMTSRIEINENTTNIIRADKSLTFGWSVFNVSLEFWNSMQMGVLSKAKELGINVIKHDEKSNEVEMLKGSIELINTGIDALIIAPYNPELLPVIVANAKNKQIPVVALDVGTGGADVAAFIVSDSFGGGVLAGEYAMTLIKKYALISTNVAIIKVQKTAEYALLRGQGFKEVMVQYGYTIVAEVTANSEESQSYEVMKGILASYKNDLSVVFCENGTMTLGAAKAIDEVGKKGKIMLIGFDSGPSIIKGIKSGSIQGTIAQQPFKMGEIGVEIANSILLNSPVTYDDWAKKEILMEVYLINEKGEVKIGII